MKKNIIFDIILVFLAYILPLFVFKQYQNDYIHIELIQKIVFSVLFFSSILLVYVNYKNISRAESPKILWRFFEILGVLGIIYSVGVLYLILVFNHGIGF